MKSILLNDTKSTLRVDREHLTSLLSEAQAEYKKKERVAIAASNNSMTLYHRVQELKDAIAKIDEALAVLETHVRS